VNDVPQEVWNILHDFWSVLAEMAPYLLFGFFVAGLLSVLISPRHVERHLGRGRFWGVIKAAAFGIPLPLCSCGVIPVSASLRRHGASRGATTAFLISTPQTGADSILVTLSLLGGAFAIYRPLAALATGVIGGWLVTALVRHGPEDASTAQPDAGEETDTRPGIVRVFSYGFDVLPRDIGRSLLVGLALAAMISTLIPKGYFADLVPPGILQMIVLMAAGVPVYVCATASIPLAFALIQTGVSPGAVFAFLMTGPATNAATIATIWKVMGKRTTFIYLATMLAGAMLGGLLLDLWLDPATISGRHGAHWMLPAFVKNIAAVVLLAVILAALLRPKLHRLMHRQQEVSLPLKMTISGMTCSHCQASVRRALQSCSGVDAVEVDLEAGEAHLSGNPDTQQCRRAVEELGYGVEDVSQE
jgi:hypothetical protein